MLASYKFIVPSANISKYSTEHDGNFPTDALNNPKITTSPTDAGTGGLDLATDLVPTYMPAIPEDPGPTSTQATTLYMLHIDGNGRLVATAGSELNPGQVITVQR